MEMKIILPTDMDALSTFFVENNVPAVTHTFHPFPLNEVTARWMACEPHLDRFYLAWEAGRPVGFSMLRGWEEGYTIPSFGTFIDHRQHGKGYGKELLRLTIEAAQALGCKQVRLSVYASNLPACKIYLACGFFETERVDTENHGEKDQKLIMVKNL